MSNYIEDASLARDIAYLKDKPEELKWLLTGNYCDCLKVVIMNVL